MEISSKTQLIARPSKIAALCGVLLWAFSGSSWSQQSALVDRIERLERMADNPVLLQMNQRMNQLLRQLQDLQNENDHLKRKINQLEARQADQYKEADDRFSALSEEIKSLPKPSIIAAEEVVRAPLPEPKSAPKSNSKPVEKPDEQVVSQLETPSLSLVAATGGVSSVESKAVVVEADQVDSVVSAKVVDQHEEPKVDEVVEEAQPEEVVEPESEPQEPPVVSMQAQPKAEPIAQEKPKTAHQAIETHPATIEEREAYKAAFTVMKKGKYLEAAESFDAFRESYPQSELASNAAYWAGEAHLVLEDLAEGEKRFKVVVEAYPKSAKVPAGMLRLADVYRQTGRFEEAKGLYQTIMERFPTQRVADKAKVRLSGM